jgi:hypothetical protein
MFKRSSEKLDNWVAFQNICKIYAETITLAELENCNWEKIVEISSQHLVAPALHKHLSLQKSIPDDVRDYFSAMHEMNADRVRIQAAGLKALVARLQKNKIEPVLLKGAANLVSQAYGDVGARFMGDIDMIVQAHQHQQAYQILHELGYHPDSDAPDWKGHVSHHEEMVMNAETGLGVELHRSIAPPWLQSLLPVETFLQRSVLVNFEKQNYRVLSYEDRIIHCIVHAQLHHDLHLVGGASLRALFDLKAITNSAAARGETIDWQKIATHFKTNRHFEVFSSQMNLCQKYLGLNTPIALPATPNKEKHLIAWLCSNQKTSMLARARFQFLTDVAHIMREPHRFLRIIKPSAWAKRWNILRLKEH